MPHRLEDYAFGRVTVDGEVHTRDLIVHDGGIIPGWRRRQGHSLVPDDLSLLGRLPATLIVGCGASGQLVVPAATLDWLSDRGVAVIPLPTAEACRRYNEMGIRGDVVAALHLTC